MLEKVELINFLVQKGVDINKQDRIRRTSLMIAVERENINAAKELIKLNADIDISDYSGRTVSDYTQFSRKREIKELLK